jgi:S1-C subfamily serine protease
VWKREDVWVYPDPAVLGISLDPQRQDRVAKIASGSAAERAGLKAGDVLVAANTQPVKSFADLQHALHRAPASESISLRWDSDGMNRAAELTPSERWRETDISWRGSMWALEPAASTYGRDLTDAERKRHGIGSRQLAFFQGNYVPTPARSAGIRANDIILGFKGKAMEMKMLEFNAYVRLNYKAGDQITYTVIRDGKHLEIPMTLPRKDSE